MVTFCDRKIGREYFLKIIPVRAGERGKYVTIYNSRFDESI